VRINRGVGGTRPHQWFTPDELATLIAWWTLGQNQIQFAGIELRIEPTAQPNCKLQIQLRVQTPEVPQQVGKTCGDKILRSAETKPSPEFGFGEIAFGPVVCLQNALRKRHHCRAIRREFYRVCVADEQSPTQLLLQPAYMLADRGLAEVQTTRRLAEILRPRHCQKAAQHNRVEHDASSQIVMTVNGSVWVHNACGAAQIRRVRKAAMTRRWLNRLHIDPYLVAIVGMVALATAFPSRGETAIGFSRASMAAVGLLFFLHGARLSREAVWRGLSHWRLQFLILAGTFVLFPLLGLAARGLVPGVLSPDLYLGLLFLCTLPSTVQSSVAFTSIARGNVPAAVCAASASSLLGLLITPLLVGLLMHSRGGVSLGGGVMGIVLQLFTPFLAGQLAQRWIGAWLGRHERITGLVDRGSILLIVYTAFSESVANGIWRQIDLRGLLAVGLADFVLLALVLTIMTFASRRLGFSREDEIATVFCGSKKSLASGVPMVNVLFPAQAVGMIVLPLMLFHQIQLMVCATLARRYLARHDVTSDGPERFRPPSYRAKQDVTGATIPH
jgi:sodium/bile acid cotransporter 7